MYRQILVEVLDIKFHENPFNRSRIGSWVQIGRRRDANASYNHIQGQRGHYNDQHAFRKEEDVGMWDTTSLSVLH